MRRYTWTMTWVALCLILPLSHPAAAWLHHPFITRPILSTMPEVYEQPDATAETLENFLLANETELAAILAQEEQWARGNLAFYAPRPEALAFTATGAADDIRERFFKAIRINPTTRTPLYRTLLEGVSQPAGRLLDLSEVSILADTSELLVYSFEEILPGAKIRPLDVAASASDEPDYGMDTGLFEDNGTAFGAYYGFGVQAFGNPNLDFGSQAPFHMGFYHESPIVYFFASFLEQSYVEYRIHLYKTLSEFAFRQGHDYWGWRFMGWGLHYTADLSMPYHTTALPGYSTFRMLLINLLDMLGWPTPKDNAMQLSSNRHMAFEAFEGSLLEDALRTGDFDNAILKALYAPRLIPPYSDAMPRGQYSKASHAMANTVDKAIATYMPTRLVSDPSVELMNEPDRNRLVELVEEEHGPGGVAALEDLQAQALSLFARYGRSFARDILLP